MKNVLVLLAMIPLLVNVTGCGPLWYKKPQPPPQPMKPPPVQNIFNQLENELKTVADVRCSRSRELVIRFPRVALFDVSEYSLRPEGQDVLIEVAKILRRYPKFGIIVEGHTDSRGNESYNQWLSEQRSRFAADVLVNAGVDPYRIQVVGYGEARPLVPEKNADARRMNRRIELHIISLQSMITRAT